MLRHYILNIFIIILFPYMGQVALLLRVDNMRDGAQQSRYFFLRPHIASSSIYNACEQMRTRVLAERQPSTTGFY